MATIRNTKWGKKEFLHLMLLRQFPHVSRDELYPLMFSHVSHVFRNAMSLMCVTDTCSCLRVLLRHLLSYIFYSLYNVSCVTDCTVASKSLPRSDLNLSSMFLYMLHDVSCYLLLSVKSKLGFKNA